MGIFDRDEMSSHDFNMRYDQKYYDRAVADQQRQGAAQWIRDNQAMMMGQQATPAMRRPSVEAGQEVLGSPEQIFPMPNNAMRGQSIADIEQPAQEATGFIGGEPSREFLEARNQAMIGSGYQSLMDQGFSNSKSTMDSVNSGINAIRGKRWDLDNKPAKGDTNIEKLHMYRASLPPGDPRIKAVDAAINKATTSSSLVDINMGDTGSPNWMSPEMKASQGIASDTPIWLDGKGAPHVIAKKDVGDKKAQIALAQMEDATAAMNKNLSTYDPNTLSELTTALVDMPTPVANMFRDKVERSMNSERKTWAEMVLRDATGAVINPSEYVDYDVMFFPQYGETPAEWERKARKRHAKENAMRHRTGAPLKEYVSPYKKKESAATDYNDMSDADIDAAYDAMMKKQVK